jgi:hypothetical protein
MTYCDHYEQETVAAAAVDYAAVVAVQLRPPSVSC